MNRKEKRLIIALISVVLLGGACYAGVKLYQEYKIQKAEEILKVEQKQVDQTFCIGDTIVLDSEEDEKPLPSGGSYDASLDWEGRMDLAVDRARLYPDLDSVLADLNREEIWTIDLSAPQDAALMNLMSIMHTLCLISRSIISLLRRTIFPRPGIPGLTFRYCRSTAKAMMSRSFASMVCR